MDAIERGVPVDPETMRSSFSSETHHLGPPVNGYQRRGSNEQCRRDSRVLTVQPQRRGSYEDVSRMSPAHVPGIKFVGVRIRRLTVVRI